MSLSQKFRSDAAIYARRDAEERVARLATQIKGDMNLRHKAHWEQKSENLIKRTIIRSRLNDLKRRQESNLEERRNRLKQLLDAEDRQYEQEFMANLETPEQVREKMAQRLEELKQRREQERQEEVNKRLEQRFKDTTDDLRKEQGKFFVYQCQMEREKQLVDKKRDVERKIMEEQVYAQLWQLDLQAKEERERQEAEEKKKRIGETVAVLDWQKDTRGQAKQQERQLTDLERQMLNEQWMREQEQEREIERQKFILGRERNLELLRHNEAEKQLREEQLRTEKERDKEMLSKAINKEQEIERIEREELLRRRKEVVELQQFYLQKAEDKKAEEQLIEYLTWLESEKQWKLKEDKWRKEDQARVNLMKQVYEDRAKAIGAKQTMT